MAPWKYITGGSFHIKPIQIPVLDSEEAKHWDALTIQQGNVDSKLLMAWAGYSVFDAIRKKKWFKKAFRVKFLLGKGNNAGDGYVLAWLIANSTDLEVELYSVSTPGAEDARYFYGLVKSLKTPKWFNLTQVGDTDITEKDIVIDALFGIGLNKALSGSYEMAVAAINSKPALKKLALDINSGIAADGNNLNSIAFESDITYCFGSFKKGLLVTPGINSSKKTKMLPVGFSKDHCIMNSARLAREPEFLELKGPGSHKYSSGTLYLLGGSEGFEGAASLAAKAFLKLGAGMAKLYTSSSAKRIAAAVPEAVIFSGTFSEICKKFLDDILHSKRTSVAVIGPGLTENISREFLATVFSAQNLHIIFDGSALRNLAPHAGLFLQSKNLSVTLTPHFSEAESLLQESIINIIDAAKLIAERYRAMIYFKGPGGLLFSNETPEEIYFNSREYSLATAGSGDVLCGFIANSLLRYDNPMVAVESGIMLYINRARKFLKALKKSKDPFTATDLLL